jgi:hypothetical protein
MGASSVNVKLVSQLIGGFYSDCCNPLLSLLTSSLINLLKPTGHVMHQHVQQSRILHSVHTVFVFCSYLRKNSDLCHLLHKLIGFYNRDEKCLQRGTDG